MKTVDPAAIQPAMEITTEDGNAVAGQPFDPVAFDIAMNKWRGFLREQLLADGFTTTEELMNKIRGR